jgi:hypothetical protein
LSLAALNHHVTGGFSVGMATSAASAGREKKP